MKRILALVTLFSLAGFCPAAHFEPYGSLLWSQVGGWAEDADESDPFNDPNTPWREQNVMSRFDAASVHSYSSSAVSDANGLQDGVFTAVISGSTLTLSGTVSASAQTTALDGIVDSYAGFSVVEPGFTTGIYYKIMPDTGENEGDLATVTLALTGSGSAPAPGRTSFGGGMGSQVVVVAVNLPIPAPETIPAENIAYSFPLIENVHSYLVNETATFKVKIGHTITIFLGADVSVTLGPGTIDSISMSSNAQLSLDITSVAPGSSGCDECDLDGSGTIDMGDLAKIASAWLTDVYPFPPPPPVLDPGTDCSTAYEIWEGCSENNYLNAGDSVWYEFYTYDSGGCYTISLCDSGFDTALEVYDECGEYIIGFNDDACGIQSRIEMKMDPWENYFIRVRGKNQDEYGDFSLMISAGCSGGDLGSDSCWDAGTIQLDTPVDGDTTGATGSDETMECGYSSDDRDVWYRFEAPSDGDYQITVSYDYYGSNFDGTLSTWDECEGYERRCTEAYEGNITLWEYLYEGQSIMIRVGSYEYTEGQFTLTVTQPPM